MPLEPKSVEVEVLPPASDRDQELMRILAIVMDDLIPIPGTRIRIGLDPLIGLIPGLGDSAASMISALTVIQGLRAGLPRIVVARMAMNILINALGGAIPVFGDMFSAWFKSNRRNYDLLRRHSGSGRRTTAGDWIFILALLGSVLVVILAASIFLASLFIKMLSLLFEHRLG